jgi:glutamate synthase (NADPH/NADH) small chain
MDCGIPFCHNGCPLGNLIPEWNDLVRTDRWQGAIERLHATNNFPEFTGRLCPAPCESACVLGISSDPVTIKQVEVEIIDRAWDEGWVVPQPPSRVTGKRVAVIGSGPAGLAAAQQLTRAGHEVAVYERADQIGGLLRYGIPEFKMEKRHLNQRLDQLRAEGTQFYPGVNVGVDLTVDELRSGYDAVVLAMGATVPRDLPVPGRELDGIHPAMDYLVPANRAVAGSELAESGLAESGLAGSGAAARPPGEQAAGRHALAEPPPPDATGKRVVIIGGGDTGADCLGTAHRQGASSTVQLEIMPMPGSARPEHTPWPTWPLIYRTSSAHEEGGVREFSVNTERFLDDGNGRVRAVLLHEVRSENGRFEKVPGTERELPADLVLLAMGFTGVDPVETGQGSLLTELGVEVDGRGKVVRDEHWRTTAPDVYVCGDAGRGQSLIVWAIAEGRACAAAVDAVLTGDSTLPSPVSPSTRPLVAG